MPRTVDHAILVSLLVLLLVACASTPVPAPLVAAAAPDDRSYLLDSAAADFATHGPPATAFRGVRFGHVVGAGDTQMALLCGEFRTDASPGEWTRFATVRTSKYEQWIGASGFCERPAVGWDADDLSEDLLRRLRAAR